MSMFLSQCTTLFTALLARYEVVLFRKDTNRYLELRNNKEMVTLSADVIKHFESHYQSDTNRRRISVQR